MSPPISPLLVPGLVAASALALLVGCSVSPPLPLEEDPEHAQIQLPAAERLDWRLAVAATDGAYRSDQEPLSWGELWAPDTATIDSRSLASLDSQAVAAVDSIPGGDVAAVDSFAAGDVAAVDSTGGALGEVSAVDSGDLAPLAAASRIQEQPLVERQYRWAEPPAGTFAVGDRLTQACSWALTRTHVVALQADAQPPAELKQRLLDMATDEQVELLIHVDLLDHQVAWVERDGAWWWTNFVVFYGPGFFPIVLVADEVYEVGLRARVSVVHVGSQRLLLTREFAAVHQRSLNDPERGWSLSGLFFLYPYTLDADAYADVQEALLPHALKELELQVVTWLHEELPARLRAPQVQALRDEEPPR